MSRSDNFGYSSRHMDYDGDELRCSGFYNDNELRQLMSLYKPPNNNKKHQTCITCGKSTKLRCSKCKNIWVCDRKCLKLSWNTHRPLCKNK